MHLDFQFFGRSGGKNPVDLCLKLHSWSTFSSRSITLKAVTIFLGSRRTVFKVRRRVAFNCFSILRDKSETGAKYFFSKFTSTVEYCFCWSLCNSNS